MNVPAPRAGILDIKAYVPGRSSVTDSQGRRVIKLSSNESALGPSPRAIEAARIGGGWGGTLSRRQFS